MTNRILWGLMAVVALVGGILALANPFAASLAATVIAGWMFVVFGGLQVLAGFRADGVGAKIWSILLGVLAIILGVMILGKPLEGMVALTTVVAVMFLAGGVAKVILSFSMEDKRFFWLILLSGVASVALGVMIFANFPVSAAASLGILLGIELLFDAGSALAMAFSRDGEDTKAAAA